MKTTVTTPKTIKRQWHLIDLNGQTLGRVSTQIARLLMGKDKTYFSPNLDCGDYVVVTNAAKIKVTGKKQTDKMYYRHSGFPGGFREATFTEVMAKNPSEIIFHSVKGMLPKNKLRDQRLKRLKVFVDDAHPYASHFEEGK